MHDKRRVFTPWKKFRVTPEFIDISADFDIAPDDKSEASEDSMYESWIDDIDSA